jgi:hypothetical protein
MFLAQANSLSYIGDYPFMKIKSSNYLVPDRGNNLSKSDSPLRSTPEAVDPETVGEPHPPEQTHSRRNFLKLSSLALASQALQREAVAAPLRHGYHTTGFEVASSLYAWDLHDEGIENILDNLQQMAKVNSVYLVALMHYEKRPLTSPTFPHNPVRKTWQAEDSKIYWHPDLKRYKRIKPELSANDWLNETDWLKVLVSAARKRGLKTGAELSHTLMSLEKGEEEYADCVQRDIHGVPRKVAGRAFPLCPNSVDAQEYTLALFSDLTANYDVDFVQTCMVPFMPGGADTGGCFCDSCVKAAQTYGIDLPKVKSVLLADPQSPAELQQWQKFRQISLIHFFKIIHDGIHGIRPDIELRFNDAYEHPENYGMDLRGLTRVWDSIRNSDYSEQKGYPSMMNHKREWFAAERAAIGPDFPFIAGVAVRPKATLELIHEGVKIALQNGAVGLSLGHYDGAEFPMLRAIKEELDAENIHVPARLT